MDIRRSSISQYFKRNRLSFHKYCKWSLNQAIRTRKLCPFYSILTFKTCRLCGLFEKSFFQTVVHWLCKTMWKSINAESTERSVPKKHIRYHKSRNRLWICAPYLKNIELDFVSMKKRVIQSRAIKESVILLLLSKVRDYSRDVSIKQDIAAPDFVSNVRYYSGQKLWGRWIGTGGPVT